MRKYWMCLNFMLLRDSPLLMTIPMTIEGCCPQYRNKKRIREDHVVPEICSKHLECRCTRVVEAMLLYQLLAETKQCDFYLNWCAGLGPSACRAIRFLWELHCGCGGNHIGSGAVLKKRNYIILNKINLRLPCSCGDGDHAGCGAVRSAEVEF